MTGSTSRLRAGLQVRLLDLTLQRQAIKTTLGYLHAGKPELFVAPGVGVRTPEHVAALAGQGMYMIVVSTKVVEHMTLNSDRLSHCLTMLREATWRHT